jgi:hypothetical protein
MTLRPSRIELSKQTIRDRASAFAKKHAGDKSEASEKQTFWNDLFAVFGREIKEAGRFEEAAKRLSTGRHGWLDLLIPGDMAVEHKSLGEDLEKAMDQAFDYLDSLDPVATPWLVVACDFQNFYWKDLRKRSEGRFTLAELADHVEIFWWLAGHQESTEFVDEEEANLVATGYMATLHDAMLASGCDPHVLREWLTRILFCLFADDTDVWDRDAFKRYIYLNTRPDGVDLGPSLAHLFQLLNTPPALRAKNLDEDLAAFTYINGDLFAATLPIANCDEAIRTALLEACKFDWSAISPAIFGSMFQNVMTPAERRHLGAHYTTEANILKTIRPLFLDDLEAELAAIKVTSSVQSRSALAAFHQKLASMTFFDPACGCGNFLVIAYREIRRLETQLLRKTERASETGARVMDVSHLLKVTVDQFYGIEIEEFPARIARTALYLMDHKANREISVEFGEYFARFPIPSSPHIRIDNALRIDWNEVLPASRATFVFGNPPFVGSRLASPEQKVDQELIWSGNRLQGKLDYVTNWFKVAATYSKGHSVKIAFVATSSIAQGEQPAVLWNELWKLGYRIDFAHGTFAWTSEASGKAAVAVVIIGFSGGPRSSTSPLWVYPDSKGEPVSLSVRNISPYLVEGPDIVLESRQLPLVAGVPPMIFGSMPRDSGHLSNISPEEAEEIRRNDPLAAKYLHRLIGGDELIKAGERYCLWLVGAEPADLTSSPELLRRLAAVKRMREGSKAPSTRGFAKTPGLFAQIAQPDIRYLAVPGVSSETRNYLPTKFFEPDVIASNATLIIPGADEVTFGILSSAMFMAWNRRISGRLESRIRISQEITYNNFPFPELDKDARVRIENSAIAVLATRDLYPTSSLADLYNPLTMPPDLVKAHEVLDRSVDKVFSSKRVLIGDEQRLEVLFEAYERISSPLLATTSSKVRSKR